LKARPLLPILILTLAGLACNLPLQTPPAAVSPSPTGSALPAATAAPTSLVASHYFFEEEFSGDFLGWSTVVTRGDADLLDLQTKEGALAFDIGGKRLRAFTLFQGGLYKNVRMDARVVHPHDTDFAADLICRYSKGEGWYQFEVFNSGLFNLYHMKWDEYLKPVPTLLAQGGSPAMRPDANILTMLCQERMLSLYVNGQMAVSYEENQYALALGQVGIGVSSFDAIPLVINFDWVKLATP